MIAIQTQLSLVEIDALFDNIDIDGNGSISFLEFVAAMIDPAEIDINHMQEVMVLCFKLLCCSFFNLSFLFFVSFLW